MVIMAMQSSHNLYIILRRKLIVYTFPPEMGVDLRMPIADANTIIHVYEMCKLCMAIMSTLCNISLPNLAVILILVRSFKLWKWYFVYLLVFKFLRSLNLSIASNFYQSFTECSQINVE